MKNRRPEKKDRKRVGRGAGSGHGKTSCRGGKGQTARSGGKVRPGFEGGQNPFYRRLPKRGFNNAYFHKSYQVLNVSELAELGEKEITPESLYKAGILKRNLPFKVLGSGELKKALTVKAHKFSQSAKTKIEAAGGKAEILKAS
jgi:large subunit ribosomal protein L15